ncbi:DoxX family membrane protein [Olivibacter sitiensis]|uniref:DoxX family membrane protein n=1 Tax=Olivibacter sitiensis TaxID=376470 RepID=UPI0003F645A9|nr:DoxX family membrane protein [Olivibacter sitiensis]
MVSRNAAQEDAPRHPLWLEAIRIVLAIVILWKGIEFVSNINAFSVVMRESSVGVAFMLSLLVHMIIVAHILGAMALFTGKYIRVACAAQMPVILMALLFKDLTVTVLNPYAASGVSLAILITLVFVLVMDVFGKSKKKNVPA